jgi:cytochrome c-type biogenesis protein CcsB
MRLMSLGLIIFLVAIGAATIIESKYDIQTAKIFIYNAKWFEILLFYLMINLLANIFKYKMFQREKIAMLAFHLAFIVIIIGAGITRFVSYEGLMMIREGKESNVIYLHDPHLWFRINDGKMQYVLNRKTFMSEQANNYFDEEVEFPGHKNPITIEYVDFKKKMVDSLMVDPKIKGSVLEIVTDGMTSNYLTENGFVMVGENALSFAKKDAMPGMEVTRVNGNLMIQTKLPMQYLPMTMMMKFRQSGQNPPDSLFKSVPTDSLVPFLPRTLYVVAGQQFVFKNEIQHAKMTKMSSGRKDRGMDILTLKITDGQKSKIVELVGGFQQMPEKTMFNFEGLTYEMEYGSTRQEIPFSIACKDFRLERYPGSNTPSSFESDVTIIDKTNNYTRHQTIFMNHVMDYNGFRFFQSAYDPDEKGTRLSVNHDVLGTNVTYVGYLLMSIGMIMSLFAPIGRFKELANKINASHKRNNIVKVLLFILSFGFVSTVTAQHDGHNHEKPVVQFMSEEHSDEVASLLVQDLQGRIIPMHTNCDQLLRKIYGKNKFEGHNSVQTVMSMHMYPPYWISQPVISVPQAVREELKLGKYASFKQLMDKNGQFKWMSQYNTAHQKLDSRKNEFDKKIIKLVERFEVMGSIFRWEFMKIIPLKGDANNTWYVPLNMELMQKDSVSSMYALKYLSAVDSASKSNAYGQASDLLKGFKKYQRDVAGKIAPSETHVNLEVRYNKMNIFKNSMYSYFVLGVIMLIFYFVRIFLQPSEKTEKTFTKLLIPFTVLMGIIFVYHGVGVGMRWYISGHAPWSNGYEAVIFIAWIAMIAGFVFSRKNGAVLPATAILAFFILFVTELNLMDPEITPLQPVLKSYWLMIHVAIITGSYGFLGLGAILGFVNMIMYIFRNSSNGKRITSQINEITAVSEMTITIGLYMLTIGTFLGGVWANESWGRYWGWDPKETWALVSVLVYAVILHLRFIPGLSGKFTFNLVSFWGFASIIFTFFGVNFYLVGLHSYAQGEGLAEIPNWIFVTVFVLGLFSVFSFYRLKMYSKSLLN